MIPVLGRADPLSSEPEGRGTVLIIEEAVPIRRALREILQKLGVANEDVIETSTGEEALARMRAAPARVVLAELVGVHAEDGLEVILEILERWPTTKVVLITAEAPETAEVRAAVRAGAFAVVQKPIRHEKIRAVLQELEAEEGQIERFR